MRESSSELPTLFWSQNSISFNQKVIVFDSKKVDLVVIKHQKSYTFGYKILAKVGNTDMN